MLPLGMPPCQCTKLPRRTRTIQEPEFVVRGQRRSTLLATHIERETRVRVLHRVLGKHPALAYRVGVYIPQLLLDHLPTEALDKVRGGREYTVFLSTGHIAGS